ncbi:MFS transporter [Streptomyces sp. NPDC048277]|uniref:MFS transporter n=1 Tax=Streptomyces sp. NPDC048277 TaxID=3155027 RepID=UPI0033F4343C
MSRARVPGPPAGHDFWLLYTSAVVSGLGDWLDQVALLVLVTTVWHGGAGDLALVVAASMLPLLVTPFLAVLVDRRQSRRVLVLTDLVQAGLTLGLVVAPTVYWAAGLVLVRSALGSVGGLAGQIQLRVSVPPDGVRAATVRLQTAMQAVKILGPAFGGLLVAFMSPRAVFAANACTFLVGVLTARALRTTSSPSRNTDLHYFEELREGFRHVFGSRILRSLLFVMCSLMFVVFLYDSMAALIVPALGMGTPYIGYMVSAVGLGGVAGSLLMGHFAERLRPFLTMAGAVLVIGCIIVAIGFAIVQEIRLDSTVWLCVIFLLGIASAGILVTFPTIVHSETPVGLTGRVWALMNSAPTVLNVLAPALAAALVVWTGLGHLLLMAGAALLLTAVVVAVRLGGVPHSDPPSAAAEGAGRAEEPTPGPAP